ncbi:MAG: hypothetical protein JF571_12100 [Asticcacaulis sp.]|nr:hypothetical protein [Asticcacaulis sp.]
MPTRSLPARARPSLARAHHKVQTVTYLAAGPLVIMAVLSPDFRHAVVHVCQSLITLILN